MSLFRSIVLTILALFGTETAAFFCFSRVCGLGTEFFLLFLAVQAAFHLVIALFLVLNRAFFYNTRSGAAEETVNAANKISLFRISMLPFLFFLILASQRQNIGPALVISTALTFLSDFIDGRLARARDMETCMGKILDSASDYLLLGTTAAAFFFYGLIKTWLFGIIIGRLFINALGMMILSLVRKKLTPQTTFFGKIAIAAIMILMVLESAALFAGTAPWMIFVEIAAGAVIGVSVIDKALYFTCTVKAASRT
jgi:phosphatidylglycerophosphate synthase